MHSKILKELLSAREKKLSVALVSDLSTGRQALVYKDSIFGDLEPEEEILNHARDNLIHDRSTRIDQIFIQSFNPPKRLIIVGAVHIAQPLIEIASTTGFSITVVDPRGAFATSSRFPGIDLSEEWPDEALKKLQIDNRTAIVTLTHDPKLDDPALEVALDSDAFYIGSLGSKKTHAKRIDRLTEAGISTNKIEKIHGPIGLPIGAKTPAEIAISIMAQITHTLHRST